MDFYTYSAKYGSHLSQKDAELVAGVANDLVEKLGRGLEPADLLEHARPADSPLHHLFQWDDKIAAEKYRIIQANYLFRSVMVVHPQIAQEVHMLTHLHMHNEPPAYYTLDQIRRDPLKYEQMVLQCVKELKAVLSKYRAVLGVAPIMAKITDLVERFLDDQEEDDEILMS